MAARWEEWEPADYGYGFFEFSGGFEDYRRVPWWLQGRASAVLPYVSPSISIIRSVILISADEKVGGGWRQSTSFWEKFENAFSVS